MDKAAWLARIGTLIAVVITGAVLPVAAAPVATLGVRVVNLAGVPPQVLTGALAAVAEMYAAIGVDVRWDADSGARDIHSQQLIVIVLPTDRSTVGNRWNTSTTLGSVQVHGRAAAIFYDRVMELTLSRGIPVGPILSWAIAHEVGHLLLPGRPHAPRGVMRAAIDPRETVPPRFTEEDAAAIRANLASRRLAAWHESVDVAAHGRAKPENLAVRQDAER